MDNRDNPFPHDGDEKNYGSAPKGGGCGGSTFGVVLFILFIIWLIWKALS